jgi:hypothetical protein
VATASARGAHGLSHKRVLGLTCEVGKVVGMLAGDERLGNGACFRRRPWWARWSGRSGGGVAHTRGGWTALNRARARL